MKLLHITVWNKGCWSRSSPWGANVDAWFRGGELLSSSWPWEEVGLFGFVAGQGQYLLGYGEREFRLRLLDVLRVAAVVLQLFQKPNIPLHLGNQGAEVQLRGGGVPRLLDAQGLGDPPHSRR